MPATALAQTYPNKPIRWVVPYTGGGITDVVTRVVTQKMQASLGQPIVVENKPGANSIIGADLVAKSAPDGYSIVTVIAAHAANATLYQGKLPFDSVKSFIPLSLAGIAPLILTANNNLPPKDVKELIAYDKANPGKLNYASTGNGTSNHLSFELFKAMTRTFIVHIPYKGSAPAVTDLIAGQVDVMFDNTPNVLPHVRAGKLKGIAVSSRTRSALAPEIPTVDEAGVPGYDVTVWFGVLTVAGTPREIVQRLNAEMVRIICSPEISGRFAKAGVDVVAGTPEHFKTFLDAEVARWAKVVKDAGIKAD